MSWISAYVNENKRHGINSLVTDPMIKIIFISLEKQASLKADYYELDMVFKF